MDINLETLTGPVGGFLVVLGICWKMIDLCIFLVKQQNKNYRELIDYITRQDPEKIKEYLNDTKKGCD